MGNPRKLAILDTYNSTKTNKTTNKQNKTVCLELPVPLDCSYWIVPSVFMNVHCKIIDLYSTPTYVLQYIVQPTISLEMPVPSQGHYGFR
jgi:hypothetical protein